MMYNFATLLEHWDSWKSTTRRFATISTAGSVQQEWMKKRATRNKVKNFVITDNVSHYIAQEWMHIHSCFQKKESHSD